MHTIIPSRIRTITSILTLAAFMLPLWTPSTTAAEEVMKEGAKVGAWTMDYSAAKDLAAEKNLPLFVNFTGSDWCGWCKLMDGNVFAKEKWQEFAAENLVLVTIDFPQDESIVPAAYKERNQALAQQYGVQGYPTYVLLTSDKNEEIGRLSASREATPESFIKQVEMMLRRNTDKGLNTYTKQLTDEQASAYRTGVQKLNKVEQELQSWIGNQPENNEENMKKFLGYQQQISSLQRELRDIEVAYLASTLDDKKAKELRDLYAKMKERSTELQNWLMTQPAENAENMEKFQKLSTEVQALEEQIAAYE